MNRSIILSNKSICQNILTKWNLFEDIIKNELSDGVSTFQHFQKLPVKNKKGEEKLLVKHNKSDVNMAYLKGNKRNFLKLKII